MCGHFTYKGMKSTKICQSEWVRYFTGGERRELYVQSNATSTDKKSKRYFYDIPEGARSFYWMSCSCHSPYEDVFRSIDGELEIAFSQTYEFSLELLMLSFLIPTLVWEISGIHGFTVHRFDMKEKGLYRISRLKDLMFFIRWNRIVWIMFWITKKFSPACYIFCVVSSIQLLSRCRMTP